MDKHRFPNKIGFMIRGVFILLGILNIFFFSPGDHATYGAAEPVIHNSNAVVLRLAHETRPDHPTNIVAQEVAKEIYKRTNGKIRLEIYENMQFGQEIELVHLLQDGKLDFAIVSAGSLATFDNSVNILELPYLFSSEEQANQALDGEPGQAVLRTLNNSGLVGVCYWENGFRSLTTKDRPVTNPVDLKDLHVRVMQNPIYISFFSQLGAVPTPMDWGEVVPALKSGIITAQENPVPIIYTSDLEKYQKYLILTEHVFDSHMVLASNSLQFKITPQEINLIFSVFQNARYRQRRLVKEESARSIDKLQKGGMKVIKPDINAFRRLGREFSKEASKKFEPVVRIYYERYLQ